MTQTIPNQVMVASTNNQNGSSSHYHPNGDTASADYGDLESESTPLIKSNEAKHVQDHHVGTVEVIGNVLFWCDFAIMGYFGDVLGDLFFPEQPGQDDDSALIKSFAVFGSAFLMRPLGGILMGYIGDVYSSKVALKLSIYLMALPTLFMCFCPTYQQVGAWSWVLLIGARLLQGISAGGQLMSSLVYSLERHPKEIWGYRGSLTMAGANMGTFTCVTMGFAVRQGLTKEQLYQFGWRLPFLSSILLALCGLYLELYDDSSPHPAHKQQQQQSSAVVTLNKNPILLAFQRKNLRQLFAASMIPMLWSGGFWFTFTWIPIYELDLIDNPIHTAMGINSCALLLSVILLFPVAGILSDQFGRQRIMTVGALTAGVLSPVLVLLIGEGHAGLAFVCQFLLGLCLSFWGAPMMAWMVESFDPEARLTSAEIGYNLGQALAGGSTLAAATWIVDQFGNRMPGFWISALATIALTGLWCVAPPVSTPATS